MEHYKFELKPLPYGYSALEPYIDTETMHLHHDKHLAAYVDKLNDALKPYPAYHSWSLEKLLRNISALPKQIQTPVKNNGGGVYNHNLYFESMTGDRIEMSDKFKRVIIKNFSSVDNFMSQFQAAAAEVFGSGYAWLVADNYGRLGIVKTANQDTVIPLNLCPLLPIDVWEHAYYLKYKNLRANYIRAWMNLINWEVVENRYAACVKNY